MKKSRRERTKCHALLLLYISWLLQKITPKISFRFYEFIVDEASQAKSVVILEIQASGHTPVQFDGTEFIRIG